MQLNKYVPITTISIWEPRWHDRKVLIDPNKVREHNKIVFTKAKSLANKEFYVSGKTIKRHKKESNGTMLCYCVPLDKLEPLEITNNHEFDLW